MKYGLRSVMLLVLVFAVIFAWIQRQREREALIELAVKEMRLAEESHRNPVKTSVALCSLKKLGTSDAEVALRRFRANAANRSSVFVSDKLPFLFKPESGGPARKTCLFYCNGLVFDNSPSGLRECCKLSEFDFDAIKFDQGDFVPTDNLLEACEIAIDHFCNGKDLEEWDRTMIELSIYGQAHHAVEHLYPTEPNRCRIDELLKFLGETQLRWDSKSGEYQIGRP